MTKKLLGVDVGGVIIDRQNDQTDTSFFGPNFLATTAVPGVFECLQQLHRNGYHIHVVSKCGPTTQQRTLQWLDHHRFFERTGVKRQDVHFCLTRAEKAPICTAQKITHFVDDRLDVLDYLQDVDQLLLFQPNLKDERRWRSSPQRSKLVTHWPEVVRLLS